MLFFIVEIETWTISNFTARKEAPKFKKKDQNSSFQENNIGDAIGKQFITSLNANASILLQRDHKHPKRKRYYNNSHLRFSIGPRIELIDNHSNIMSSMQFSKENLEFMKENNFESHSKSILKIKLKNNS